MRTLLKGAATLFFALLLLQAVAQPPIQITLSESWQRVLVQKGVTLSVRAFTNPDREQGARIKWRVDNSTDKIAYVTGSGM